MRYEARHPFPLAEHNHLFAFCFEQGGDDVQCLVYLCVVACLLVEDIGTVTEHTHLREAKQQAVAVFLGEEMHPSPFRDDLPYDELQLFMFSSLFLGHRHKEYLVLTLRHL